MSDIAFAFYSLLLLLLGLAIGSVIARTARKRWSYEAKAAFASFALAHILPDGGTRYAITLAQIQGQGWYWGVYDADGILRKWEDLDAPFIGVEIPFVSGIAQTRALAVAEGTSQIAALGWGSPSFVITQRDPDE